MSIKIERTDVGYTAVVTPSPRLNTAWSSEDPMTSRDLTERLLELGYHLQDIVDAFTFADPDWMSRED
jgi:hypothetical protein